MTDPLEGLPLEMALQAAREQGLTPEIIRSAAPPRPGRQPEEDRSSARERVVRVRREGSALQLTVCAFLDRIPGQK